jgi:hypothetical protein
MPLKSCRRLQRDGTRPLLSFLYVAAATQAIGGYLARFLGNGYAGSNWFGISNNEIT